MNLLVDNKYNVYTLNRGTRNEINEDKTKIICDRNDRRKMKDCLEKYEFDAVIDVCGLNKLQEEILMESLYLDSIKKFVFISSSAVFDVENIIKSYIFYAFKFT